MVLSCLYGNNVWISKAGLAVLLLYGGAQRTRKGIVSLGDELKRFLWVILVVWRCCTVVRESGDEPPLDRNPSDARFCL